MIPQRGESQSAFVARANRELYRKIPDALKRNRFILKCWREAGRDGQLARMAAERFPENKYQTIHDLPIFPEHRTVGSDGTQRVYDRKALEAIVNACNTRILDTGDFSALTAGHTPDDPTSAHAVVPEVLGYEGPFRLGMIGNVKPKWCIFADEHHRRDRLEELEHRPRRSAEVWLEDNILDPIAALGAETPRLDTGIVRNCRLPSGRVVSKYSAMATSPAGMNTSVQTFGKPRRETYAAGDQQMHTANETMPNAPAGGELEGLSDQDIERIAQSTADLLMQSKPMQWVQSQMPPDWTPGEGESDEIPPEHADLPAGDGAGLGDGMGMDDDSTFQPEGDGMLPDAGADLGGGELGADGMGGEAPPDVGAATAASFPEDEAMPEEIDGMDDEDKERYAAHDSAGRKGFLQAWRKHRRKVNYSAGGGSMPVRESYSRLSERLSVLEQENRKLKRFSRLSGLSETYHFDPEKENEETKTMTDSQFDRHCETQVVKYERRRVPFGEYTRKLPVDQAERISTPTEDQKRVEKYSRRALEIADAAIKADQWIPYAEAYAKAVQEIDGVPAK